MRASEGTLLQTIRDALTLVGPDRRRKFLLVGILAAVVSALEAVAAVLVLVLMRLVLEPGELPEVPLLGDLRAFSPTASYQAFVLWFVVAFGLFMVLRSSAFLFQQYALGRISQNTGVLLADRLFEGYLSMSYEFHLRRNSSELIRNAYDNVSQLVGSVFTPLATVFAEGVLVVVMVAVLIAASPVATAVAGVIISVAVIISFAVVQPRLKQLGASRQSAAKSALRHLQQGLGGLRDVKVLGREQGFARSFRESRAMMARAEYLRAVLAYVPRVSIEIAFLSFVLLAVVFAVFQNQVETALATIGLFAYAGLRLQPALQKIATSLTNVRYAQAAVDDLKLDMARLDASAEERRSVDVDPRPLPFDTAVRFEQVGFKYPGARASALTDLDLTIPRGESLGICGPTGGGKTTVLDLLCGLLSPTDGRLTVDGRDLKSHTRRWQRNLGVVHQSSFLIDDTLARNIAFGVDSGDIDAEALELAIDVAQLRDVVNELPEGVATMVGERGVRLSGGQRQRITLARAIYRRPAMMILDEATSALDNATETAVIEGLARLPTPTTLVMVAHRLASLRHCDRLILIDRGGIAATGSYDQLWSGSSEFRSLVS